jgi:hypothetical protein
MRFLAATVAAAGVALMAIKSSAVRFRRSFPFVTIALKRRTQRPLWQPRPAEVGTIIVVHVGFCLEPYQKIPKDGSCHSERDTVVKHARCLLLRVLQKQFFELELLRNVRYRLASRFRLQ